MRFILNLALREMRASWHRLLFFFICIAVGVGSIVALRSLVQNVNGSVTSESRSLLTADVQVSTNAPWSPEARAVLDRYRQSPMVAARTEVLEAPTMLRSVKDAAATPKMVEVKAVQPQFPFYGEMVLAGGQAYSHELLKNHGLLVRESLLIGMGLRVGDAVRLGNQEFTIRGVIEREPGNSMAGFGFAPRVLIDYDEAAGAGLTGWGSRSRFRALFKAQGDQVLQLTDALKQDLKSQPLVNIRSFRFSQDQMSKSLEQVENYLSLIGLVILVLGGIGISSVTRVFVQQKMKTIAVLKCLGGRNSRVLGAYLAQVMVLGLVGSLMGLVFARAVVALLPRLFAGALPFNVEIGLTLPAMLQGLAVGLLISLLFSLVPLLEIRRIKPILVLRGNDTAGAGGWSWRSWRSWKIDWLSVSAGAVVVLGLMGVASWQAGSLRIGGIFLAGLAGMTLVLTLAATGLMKFLRGLRHIPSFTLRQGINSLYRPGNQTRIILLAVGLGVFFVVGVRSLQLNLRYEFNPELDTLRADMYLVDIQRDQRPGIEEIVAKYTGGKPQIVPTVRARISRINDAEINLNNLRPEQNRSGSNRGPNQGMLGREYVLTYRENLDESETLTEGAFWSGPPGGEPEISIEELLHEELKLGLGDRVTFDVLGQKVTARVTSIRRVDWRNARTGFLVVFRPGPLDNAPTMYISAIKGPHDAGPRAQVQRELVDRFPNVSVIDVRDIIEAARGIIQNVSLAVSIVGGFVFFSGLLILIGSIAMTKFHRLYESAILKTLGARRKLIILTLVVEYGVLGLLSGLLGSVAAIALTWAISEYGLQITWRFIPSVNLLGVGAAFVLVTLVGVLSSWDVMIRKPLGILRAE
ncbi:MAG: FtsX-like permease family protein [Blastocatellia bacterium]|nr:FtsX-like permease family protein [Blastocatellia bacterium]